ncbi:hypothetical protein SAMN05216352_1294 [Alteribacillus bidgolensis]|uniref:Uncharacterized protein n=1 Tax=Alteribacillus bidgolensis TaxID=930129 RepID=A0A1G8RKZ3_9BACI|nr:hypothetical protein SAMN05216352_1294 [Alteribacillus bidgolensis]
MVSGSGTSDAHFCVCSDKKVTWQSEDIHTHDIGFPATTDAHSLTQQLQSIEDQQGMTAVFSTYQNRSPKINNSIETASDKLKKDYSEN